jgi:hypothetical protein
MNLDFLFSNFRWYRKLIGGKWEQWWLEGPYIEKWFRVHTFTGDYMRPDPACRGTPVCEDWTKK